MTNLNVIENKISAAKKYIRILENYRKYSREEIEKNIDIRGAVERYLYLAVQAAIDLAEAVISFKNFRKPTAMAESFTILSEEGIINEEFAGQLIKMVGFRNIIIHDYGEIDYDIVYNILHQQLKDIEKFIEIVDEKI